MNSKNFSQWYVRYLHSDLAALTRARLQPLLSHTYGYHALIFEPQHMNFWEKNALISHVVSVYPFGSQVGTRAHFSELPFQSESIDLIILPHTLDFFPQSRAIFAEIQRVLRAEGVLLVVGFNPYSAWGFSRLWRRKRFPKQIHSPFFLRHQMEEAGLTVDDISTFGFHRKPFLEILGGYCCPSFGNIYVVAAKKEISTLTPLQPLWHKKSLLQWIKGQRPEPVISYEKN